jgi:hypothetical protein
MIEYPIVMYHGLYSLVALGGITRSRCVIMSFEGSIGIADGLFYTRTS